MNFFGKMKAQTSETVHNGRSLPMSCKSRLYFKIFGFYIFFYKYRLHCKVELL